MSKAELIKEIEKTAKEANSTEIEIITIMQGHLASIGDEKSLSVLCDIKYDYITI